MIVRLHSRLIYLRSRRDLASAPSSWSCICASVVVHLRGRCGHGGHVSARPAVIMYLRVRRDGASARPP